MKRVIKYGVLVLAILGFLPFITGVVIQRQYENWMHSFLSTNLEGFTIKTVEYHRGWFSTTILSEIHLPIEEPQKVHILEEKIQHGPFLGKHVGIAQMKAHLLLSEEEKAFFGTEDPFEWLVRMNLLGNAEMHLQGYAFHYKSPLQGGWEVKGDGLTGHWYLSRGFKAEKGNVHLPSFELLQNGQAFLSFTDFRLLTQTYKNKQDLWLGEYTFELGAAYWFANAVPTEARLLRIHYQMTEDSEELSLAANEQIESIRVGEELYGPIFLDLAMGPMNAQGMANLRDYFKSEKMPNPTILFQKVAQVFPKPFELKLGRFQIDCPEGLLKAEGLFSMAPQGEVNSVPALLADSTAHFTLSAAPALVQSFFKRAALSSVEGKPLPQGITDKDRYVAQLADQMLKAKEQEGVLTLIDNVYHIKFNYQYKNGGFQAL